MPFSKNDQCSGFLRRAPSKVCWQWKRKKPTIAEQQNVQNSNDARPRCLYHHHQPGQRDTHTHIHAREHQRGASTRRGGRTRGRMLRDGLESRHPQMTNPYTRGPVFLARRTT